jgi:heterodisulfide reductase subunit B
MEETTNTGARKKFGFFLGCNMPAIRPDVERSIRLTLPALGVDLEDLPGYVCCPAFGTFPSLDDDAHLAVSAWNMSIGEAQGVDLMVECGSCYSSLRTGRHMLQDEAKRKRVEPLLEKAGKRYEGTGTPRHVTDVLYNEIGLDRIRAAVKQPLEGVHAVVQYPCHTLFPSDIVGFEESSVRPHVLADLMEALGATVDHFSLEHLCCGGAGGFHGSSRAECEAFSKRKFDAILAETQAQLIVVSCITCLMHLDNVQKELESGNGSNYSLPVFDYNQLLALCMGFPPDEVAALSTISREPIVGRFRS